MARYRRQADGGARRHDKREERVEHSCDGDQVDAQDLPPPGHRRRQPGRVHEPMQLTERAGVVREFGGRASVIQVGDEMVDRCATVLSDHLRGRVHPSFVDIRE